MRIKEVETLVGIAKKNIRYYEQEGLLTPGRNAENSYREYDEADVARLKSIKLLRKLGIPISEIREVLNGELSLPVAARRHIASLDGQIESLEKSRIVCKNLAEGGKPLDALDTDALLDRMEQMEQEGAVFVNVKKRDVKSSYVGPIIACTVVVLFALVLIGLLVYFHAALEMPAGIMWVVVVFCLVLAGGTIGAFISRVKEIRRGEADDLSNY